MAEKKAICAYCLSGFPREEMTELGSDLLCPDCHAVAAKKSQKHAPPPEPEPEPPPEEEPREISMEERIRLRSHVEWLGQQMHRRPDDLTILEELVEAYDKLGDAHEADNTRKVIERIDPSHPALKKKEEVAAEAKTTVKEKAPEELPPPPPPFWTDIGGIFRYPVEGRGIGMLLVGGIAFSLALAGTKLNPLGYLVLLPVLGYLSAYWFQVMSSAAKGKREPPDGPDATNVWETFFQGLVVVLVLSLLTIMPFILLGWAPQNAWVGALRGLTLAWGIFAFPMALLVYAMFHSLGDATRLSFLLDSIRRCLADYLILFLFLALTFAGAHFLVFAISLAAHTALPYPVAVAIHSVVQGFLLLYCLTIASYLIGYLYDQAKYRLGWFVEAEEPVRAVPSGAVPGAIGVGLGLVGLLALTTVLSPEEEVEQILPIQGGRFVEYTVSNVAGTDASYRVRYEFERMGTDFKIRMIRVVGQEQNQVTEPALIDGSGNFVQEAPDQESPISLLNGEPPDRSQSILCGPTAVEAEDVYRNESRVLRIEPWEGWDAIVVHYAAADSLLYYDRATGYLVGMERTPPDPDRPRCVLTRTNVPGLRVP